MNKLSKTLFVTAASAVVAATPALAIDYSKGNKGNPEEATRALPGGSEFSFRRAKPMPEVKLQDGEIDRALALDEESLIKSYTAVGRTHDGKELRVEPNDEMKTMIRGDLNATPDSAPSDRIDIA